MNSIVNNVNNKNINIKNRTESSEFLDIKSNSDTNKNENISIPKVVETLNKSNELAIIDRYGFLISDRRYDKNYQINEEYRRKRVWLENQRTRKWIQMVGKQGENWEIFRLKNPNKLKSRVRKGIPEALRGKMWCYLTNSALIHEKNPGLYRSYLSRPRFPYEETIGRDIGRTFPKHSLFLNNDSVGQHALLNVLKAYSIYDPEVGYCQGMGFITAMFLSYMPEEDTFWNLVACMTNKIYLLADLYRPMMPRVPEILYIFDKLMNDFIPEIVLHLNKEGLHPTMYASQWFITLYTYSFPFELVTRIWDIFLYEGWKIIYRIALGLLKISKKTILASEFEGIMEFFRELPNNVDTENLLKTSFQIPLTRKRINMYVKEYQENRNHSPSSNIIK